MEKYLVIIDDNKQSEPRPHESKAAQVLANHSKSNILFLRRVQSKTPDLLVLKSGIHWELKSPTGGGKHTIQNNLRDADKQSNNIVLDLSRIKLTERQSISRIKFFIKNDKSRIKRIKIITKDGRIVDIKK